MSDRKPRQADGAGGSAKQPDGVNSAGPDGDGGGPYPNGVKGDPGKGGFMGHGGQTEVAYSGSKGGEGNAAAE